ncbi:uncharacterized protein MELLADRAFT_124178 [Melampsora larici-populina 98AG31]|uniref:Secreted protein n=1 Tax=Melampsora larici-populina (strain 98AG31 / pathotype 3-4-7) TaxID=747676 RepID=F4RX81_MELLP|nr:uncharacterized protein MELLADRAFT_124178 [Melampsora larici-populina 98AG31]EGG03035.1 secreted protein [Melampsora larici-populina 98AG31]
MLLKISLLIVTLWIHGAVSDYTCNTQFTIDANNNGICKGQFVDQTAHEYSCVRSSCADQNRNYSPMSGCKGNGSSNQNCAQYTYNKSADDYTCINLQKTAFTCPDTPANVPAMTCTSCTKVN